LRSAEAEARQIATVVSHYALAYPEVGFSLRVDGRQSLSTGGGPLGDAVAAVYGAEVAAAMLPIEADSDITVSGLVAPPSFSRASRNYVSIFINRRWVQNRRLAYAVSEAYHGLLMVDRHPIAIVNVALPPREVDVNVHPTKAEVRFRNEGEVFAAIQRSVRQALLQHAPVPSLAYTGVSPLAAASQRTAPLPPLPPMWRAPDLTAGTGSAVAQAAPSPLPKLALPALRVVGQIDNTYVIAEGPDGMYLIDQHAAHERVLFEEITSRRGTIEESQGLLSPRPVELTAAQEELLRTCGEALAEQGFSLEPFGPRAHLIRSMPPYLQGDPRDAFLAFLDRLATDEGADSAERVAKSLSCHSAVRAGKTLSLDEMRELVRRLEASQLPHTCPHGRPTMIHMSTVSLEREFHRR
jgi:DNA mismatch repair protein MutL